MKEKEMNTIKIVLKNPERATEVLKSIENLVNASEVLLSPYTGEMILDEARAEDKKLI